MKSTWTIQLPHCSRSDTPADLGANAHALKSPEDRARTRQLALIAAECGVQDVGEIIDGLESLDANGRRTSYDTLCTKAGLATTAEIEHRATLKEMQVHVASEPRPVPTCAAEGCEAIPIHPVTWMPVDPGVKRWWCPSHELHLAEPGDFGPPPSGMRFNKCGGMEEIPPSDLAAFLR